MLMEIDCWNIFVSTYQQNISKIFIGTNLEKKKH